MTTNTNDRRETAVPEQALSIAPGPQQTRERSDLYMGEIFRSGEYRVALCRDGIQWVLQRRRKSTHEGATAAWDSVAFLTTRATLVRLWRAHTDEDGADLLALLPERVRREVVRGS